MYLVYLLPLFLVVLVALAFFTGPVIAAIVFVLFLVGLGLYKFFGPGTVPEHETAPDRAAGPAAANAADRPPHEDDENTGPWGETWPERSQ
jgi:hypothetical protein